MADLRNQPGGRPSLSVVVPVYNSEATIGRLAEHVVTVLTPHVERLEVVLVNDGSHDNSHSAALKAVDRHPGTVRYVRLARNFGEHNAVMCGLHHTSCQYAAIIDDDFQQPPAEILKLLHKIQSTGADVVYGCYVEMHQKAYRNLGSRFHNWVASTLLRKPRWLYLSSFKLMNRFLIDEICRYEGPYPYLDGLILRATSAIETETVEHRPREVGKSTYTLRRLIRLWLNMVTSHSVLPLRISSVAGFTICIVGLLLSLFFIASWSVGGIFLHDAVPPGWASTICLITVLGGAQLCMLGILGEYLGRLYLSSNRQPQWVVRERIGWPREGS
jgi:undecaprenyl-phosphate 4-deoxy-4-formamido-L-arabinose transferase